MFPIAAAAGVANGIVSGIVGFGQRRRANKLLRGLSRPQYNIPNEVLQNQQMAKLAAGKGLPSEQYAQAMQNISRQQNKSLADSMDRRGGLMTIAQNQQMGNDASLNLGVASANARRQNQQALYGINNQVAGYRDKQFEINQMQPYQEKYNYGMALKGAGLQNILGGVDKALGGIAGGFGGGGMGGGAGLFGGGSRGFSGGGVNKPNYGAGYDENSQYSDFQTGY